jgi:hypothetical protein
VRLLGDVLRISADTDHVIEFFDAAGRLLSSQAVSAGEAAIVLPSGIGPTFARARRAGVLLWSLPLLR